MAEPTFGQDKIRDIPPLNLLDALYAQGLPLDFLRQMSGMRTPEITSFLLRNNQDRYLIERAVNMAKGKEIEALGGAKDDYEKVRITLANRGVNVNNYKGPKTVEGIAAWARPFDPQLVGNALATALPPIYKNVGGVALDDHRKMVTGFSAPPPPEAPPTVPTTRGIPSPGGQGVRGQGGPTGVPGEKPGGPKLTGQTPGPTGPAAGAGGGGGPGAGGTPPPKKMTPAEIRADIESKYGWAAAFMDVPEIAEILNRAANGTITADEANNLWLGSQYYKETSVNGREWRILEKSNPGEAALQMEGQVTSITNRARGLGVDLDPARAAEIARNSKRFGWSDQMVAAAIASEAKYDPDGAKVGVMAQIKGAQQSQLVPMSDGTMTQWAQAIIGGAKSLDDFNAYLKDQAKSLFPSIANYLDTTPNGTVRQYLDPYAETISKTLGMPAGDIDWMDPKWFRFVNTQDPKTGERRAIDIADVQRHLITDPQYGYDKTANGKQSKANLARTILQDWGFLAPADARQGGGF